MYGDFGATSPNPHSTRNRLRGGGIQANGTITGSEVSIGSQADARAAPAEAGLAEWS